MISGSRCLAYKKTRIMKTTLAVFFLIITFGIVQAQEAKPLPRTEFLLDLTQPSVTVGPGKSTTLDLGILRSKGYKNSTATLGLSSSLPEGISVVFDPDKGAIDKTTVTITAAATTRPGAYMLILKATLQNHTKGATLKLIVEDTGVNTTTSVR
jgi:hypothetical protein